VRERMDMVERREVEVERRRAVDAAASAIAHRGALDRPLLISGSRLRGASRGAGWTGGSRKGHVVNVLSL
jgi:hypothetical protein